MLELLDEKNSSLTLQVLWAGFKTDHVYFHRKDREIGESVTLGVNKINISSDIKAAYFDKMREVLQDRSLREPNEIEPPCIEAMKVVAKHKLDLFRTTGKAVLYR